MGHQIVRKLKASEYDYFDRRTKEKLGKGNFYEDGLIGLNGAISEQVPMPREDQVLIAISLDTEKKIVAFNSWVKSRMHGETLNAKKTEIVRAAVKIGKRETPE